MVTMGNCHCLRTTICKRRVNKHFHEFSDAASVLEVLRNKWQAAVQSRSVARVAYPWRVAERQTGRFMGS